MCVWGGRLELRPVGRFGANLVVVPFLFVIFQLGGRSLENVGLGVRRRQGSITCRGTVAREVCRWARVSRSTRHRMPLASMKRFALLRFKSSCD